jgi:hypothetical protein
MRVDYGTGKIKNNILRISRWELENLSKKMDLAQLPAVLQ